MKDMFIGLQLYTVRDETAKDFSLTLHRVAQMGYTAVEFAGYGNLPSREMAALLADTGLRAAGTHVGLAALAQDIERELNYCLDIGCSFLVVPYLPAEQRSIESVPALANRLNEIGQRCHERGITLAYHNHDFEFAQYNGAYFLDTLLEATDPELVKIELDTYWAAFAGVEPTQYLCKYDGRVRLVHLKDMTPDRHFTEVGAGTLDIVAYCRAAYETGTRYFLVENDRPLIPSLESARLSLEYLTTKIG